MFCPQRRYGLRFSGTPFLTTGKPGGPAGDFITQRSGVGLTFELFCFLALDFGLAFEVMYASVSNLSMGVIKDPNSKDCFE